MPKVLKARTIRSILTNGKVEMQLKTFLGMAWTASARRPHRRTFLMDKRFGPRLDLVAFEGDRPYFWLEAKCDFAADRDLAQRSALRALDQINGYMRHPTLPHHLRQCPAYIVHFLCRPPDREEYPSWAGDRFDSLRAHDGDDQRLAPKELQAFYEDNDHGGSIDATSHLAIDFDCGTLGAVVVKMTPVE